MARPKYRITDSDYWFARRYIDNAMDREEISKSHGWGKFIKADTAEKLQAWCDDYMDEAVFKKMKTAIMAARKRQRDALKRKSGKGITLKPAAHNALYFVAKELELPLSETIQVLEEVFWKAKDKKLVNSIIKRYKY